MDSVKKSEDLGAMSALRLSYSEQLFAKLAEVLNDVHQLNHSVRFWKLITEEYVRAILSRKPRMESIEMKTSPCLFPIVSQNVPGRSKRIKRSAGRFYRYLKTRSNRALINRLLKENMVLMSGFKGIPEFQDETGSVELPDQDLFVLGTGNKKARKRIEQIAGQAESLFIKNVIRQIPRIYVEHFRSLYNSVELYDPGSKTFHILGNFYLGRRQLTIARYIEEGARLIWYQNGGYIGEVVSKYSRYLSHGVADEYRTWGWRMTEKDRPGKAWYLEKFRDTHQKKNCSEKEYDILLCFPKMTPGEREMLIKNGSIILNHLDKDRYSKIIVRPRLSGSVTGQVESLQKMIAGTEVKLSSGMTSMADETASARCVIQMSVPATNFLECIYVDHPTMGVLNNDQPTDIIKPWYKFLEQKGVLHFGPAELTDFLNHIDIEEWWSELISKDGYREFKQNFARQTEGHAKVHN